MAEDLERYNSSLTGADVDVALQDMAQRISERYAKGTANGVPVTSGQIGYQDNAKYYAQQAKTDADRAESAVPIGTESAVLWTMAQNLTDSAKAQARANISAGGSNPNLLDNGWFTIDQRQGKVIPKGTLLYDSIYLTTPTTNIPDGITPRTELAQYYGFVNGKSVWYVLGWGYCEEAYVVRGYVGQGYTVDRWESFYPENVVKVTDNGIVIKCKDLCQKIPLKDIPINTPLTASILYADGEIDYLNATFSGGRGEFFEKTTPSKNVKFWVAYDIWVTTGNFQFFINTNGGEVGVLAVKLEPGTVSTLANDVAPNPTEELIKCLPYYVNTYNANSPYTSLDLALTQSASWLNCGIRFPVKMRTVPTIKLKYIGNYYAIGSNVLTNSMVANGVSEQGFTLVNAPNGEFDSTAGTRYGIAYEASAEL